MMDSTALGRASFAFRRSRPAPWRRGQGPGADDGLCVPSSWAMTARYIVPAPFFPLGPWPLLAVWKAVRNSPQRDGMLSTKQWFTKQQPTCAVLRIMQRCMVLLQYVTWMDLASYVRTPWHACTDLGPAASGSASLLECFQWEAPFVSFAHPLTHTQGQDINGQLDK
ncbi:hypothetical protein BD289DRAFT_43642 [Coniella lustricola]|uniref:Uncharacterized protein n=1 Tax=Coniella lustricola TaxID=2025994 RepID=A0A2T3A1T8_9PEZI|nr:hypothetical protein BD289DRAFT_43642 [Coniella lustricola]